MLGVSLPLSGTYSLAGTESREAMELAAEEINAAGGVLGRKIQFIFEDDGGVPQNGTTIAQKLISRDKVPLILGAYNSSVALALTEVTRREGIPVVLPGSSAPAVTQKNEANNPWVFRTYADTDMQANAFGKYMVNTVGAKKYAILYENTDFGKSLEQQFTKIVTGLGAQVVMSENYKAGSSDFLSELTKVKNNNPDALYIAGVTGDGAQFLRQAKELGLKVKMLGTGGMVSDKLIELAGPENAEGMFLPTLFEPTTDNKGGQEFAKRFQAKFKKPSNTNHAIAYEAVKLAADAITRAGKPDAKAIRDALVATSNFKSILGPEGNMIKFNEFGQVTAPIGISVIQKGQRQMIGWGL